MMIALRVLRCAAVGGCVATGMFFAVVGAALAGPPAPLTELEQAKSHIAALEGTGDIRAKAALGAAVAYLGVATAESLWVDSTEAVPPPEGSAVFADTAAAVKELTRIHNDHTVAEEALLSASGEILEAEDDLADIALEEVQGSSTAAGSPTKKWQAAFHTLGKQISSAATSVPQSTVEQAASNYLSNLSGESAELYAIPQSITGPPLTSDGRPELFYYGAEGCPFCGIDRWSMVTALAQFGKLSPLGLMVSSTYDIDPSTHTLTFSAAKFKSSYVAFVPVEGFTNQPGGTLTCGANTYPFWTPLQALTSGEQELINRYDGYEGCFEGLPFLDAANQWSTIGSYGNPEVIAGMSWQQIVAALGQPSSVAGQAIDGGAEIITAQICDVDGQQPARICDSTVVRRYQEEVGSGFRSSLPPPP